MLDFSFRTGVYTGFGTLVGEIGSPDSNPAGASVGYELSNVSNGHVLH